MPKKKKHTTKSRSKVSDRAAFESSKNPGSWLEHEAPLVCDAVRMQPEVDPWERKGKIVR